MSITAVWSSIFNLDPLQIYDALRRYLARSYDGMSFIQMKDRLLPLPPFLPGFTLTSFSLARHELERQGLAFFGAWQSLISAVRVSDVSTQAGWRPARTIDQTTNGPAVCTAGPSIRTLVGLLPPPPPSTPPTAAPLGLFNRRNCVGCMVDSHSTRWSSFQSRHAEEAKSKSHQRCYHYSLHQVCLRFLLSSIRDEDGEYTQHS